MMQRVEELSLAEVEHWSSGSGKRSSGLLTVWRWLKGGGGGEGAGGCDTAATHSTSSSASDVGIVELVSDSESVASADTCASFSWVRPAQYADGRDLGGGDSGRSLPLPMTKREPSALHRRSASESARLHVRGKRRAPQPPRAPPASTADNTVARRKKRMAPPPPLSPPPVEPDVISNDTLRLERGVLRSARRRIDEDQQIQQQQQAAVVVAMQKPRPWYKRAGSKGEQDKRRSCNMSFLTNISELDRQTMQILERETLKLKYLQAAPASPQPREEVAAGTPSPRARSARDLIARFNAITTRTGLGGSSEKQSRLVKFPQASGTPPLSPAAAPPPSPTLTTSRAPWPCPRCTCHNDYWRIICRVCSAIKPYFDDFTSSGASATPVDRLEPSPVTNTEITMFGKQIFEGLRGTKVNVHHNHNSQATPSSSHVDQICQFNSENIKAETQINSLNDTIKDYNHSTVQDNIVEIESFSVNDHSKLQKDREKISSNNNLNGLKAENLMLGEEISVERPEYINVAGGGVKIMESMSFGNSSGTDAKREEHEKLKKILIDMKNSLSKRTTEAGGSAKRVSVVREEVEKEENETQREGADDASTEAVPATSLMVVTQETVYENVYVKKGNGDGGSSAIKVSSSAQTGGVAERRAATEREASAVKAAAARVVCQLVERNNEQQPTYTNVAHVNDLLHELEAAISGGKLERAAAIASELALHKVPCSVIRQQQLSTQSSREVNTERQKEKEEEKATVTDITLSVYVEDRVSTSGPFPVTVRGAENGGSATVGDLQAATEHALGLPRHLQRWILGRRLASDDTATLADHDVTESGCPAYVYLVQPEQEQSKDGAAAAACAVNNWTCAMCTLVNDNAAGECSACGQARVSSAAASSPTPDTYHRLVDLDNEADAVHNTASFECLVCLTPCQAGDGCVLRDCLHQFCRECLAQQIELSDDPVVACPYRDAEYSCAERLQEREVRALVSPAAYERHLTRSVLHAERQTSNAYHCRTQDCRGWCTYDDNVNEFLCPVCNVRNCLTCQAVHAPLDCADYQRRLRDACDTSDDARRTRDWLERAVAAGEAMHCPTCRVVLMKKWGCDWVRCSVCRTEICWVTRGPRWGPRGKGDTSGGCRCGLDGAKCHPKCNYCH